MIKTRTKATAPSRSSSKPKKAKRQPDRSAGQSELVAVFNAVSRLFTPYKKGSMKLTSASAGKAALISTKPVEIFGRKRDEVWFASAQIQKGYVGFHFMPAYMDDEIKKLIAPGLLKCLKGQACFHIKKADKKMLSEIRQALKIGYDCWRRRGWL